MLTNKPNSWYKAIPATIPYLDSWLPSEHQLQWTQFIEPSAGNTQRNPWQQRTNTSCRNRHANSHPLQMKNEYQQSLNCLNNTSTSTLSSKSPPTPKPISCLKWNKHINSELTPSLETNAPHHCWKKTHLGSTQLLIMSKISVQWVWHVRNHIQNPSLKIARWSSLTFIDLWDGNLKCLVLGMLRKCVSGRVHKAVAGPKLDKVYEGRRSGTMRSRNSFGSVIGVCWKLVLGHIHDVARGGANNWGGQEGGEKGHAFDHACSGGMPLWWSCGCWACTPLIWHSIFNF